MLHRGGAHLHSAAAPELQRQMALHAQLHKEVEVEEVDKISLNLSNHSFSSHSHSGMLRTLSKLSNAPAPFMIMTQLPVQLLPLAPI
jgi:hypothetical protein